jgi:hypothetical protein
MTQMMLPALQARTLATQGRDEDLPALIGRSVQIAERTDLLVDHADMRMDAAGALSMVGRAEEAASHAAAALDLYRRKGHLVGVSHATTVLASLGS